jgi:UPF0271 protein
MKVDLNCDMGESFGPWIMGDDAAMFDLVTSANIACGFHAGDPDVMRAAVTMAKEKGVAIGAHPGFQDVQGFGRRRVLGLSSAEIENMVTYQIGALMGVAALAGHKVTHVKAHGALSNMGCEDLKIASAIASAIKGIDRNLVFVVLPLSQLEKAGEQAGLTLAREVFADRAYEDDGNLVSRAKPGSVLHDASEVADRVLRMVEEGAITAASGKKLTVSIDTICIHGDTPAAVSLARSVRQRLDQAGISVSPFAGT